MASQEKRDVAVPKYFMVSVEEPKYNNNLFFIILTVGGILSILFGMTDFDDYLGFLCVGGGALILGSFTWLSRASSNKATRRKYNDDYKRAEPKPSDQQIDAWHHGDLERIKNDAPDRLDLLPEQIMGDPQDPIMIVGPSSGALAKMGKDGIIRFSRHDIVVVYLSDYHLAAYSTTLDLTDGLAIQESTQEYHYVDVVSVSTQTDNSQVFRMVVEGEEKPIASFQKFALSVASGEKIEVAISFPNINEIIKGGTLAPTGAEKAIKIIRARLREKKGGTQE